jgi:hypothetical protein
MIYIEKNINVNISDVVDRVKSYKSTFEMIKSVYSFINLINDALYDFKIEFVLDKKNYYKLTGNSFGVGYYIPNEDKIIIFVDEFNYEEFKENFNEWLEDFTDVIEHELIHKEQSFRSKDELSKDIIRYRNKKIDELLIPHEIMAYAKDASKELFRYSGNDKEKSIKFIKNVTKYMKIEDIKDKIERNLPVISMYYYEVDKNTWKKFINKVYEYLMEY